MREFRTLLNSFKQMSEIVQILTNKKDELKSTRLKSLVTRESEGGFIPDNIE